VRVSLRGLRKTFTKGEAAVDIRELDIDAGEFVTFVGPSGCGKSTTMRMISGLEEPTEGTIHFGDRRMNDVSVQKRNIAMVFQNYALYPHMRVAQNLEYGLAKRGVAAAERAESVAWVAALLRIEKLLQKKPAQLSGGEQQRVALGRAIIRTPDVLLLDEPLSNLDAKLRTFMRAELVKLQRAVGCTTIFVTHDQLEAMTMSDRIAVMSHGRIEQFATPADIYDRPATTFVAGFVGSPPMNFFEGQIENAEGRPMFRGSGLELPFPGGYAAGLRIPADGKVIMGARPEQVELVHEGGDVPVVVSLVELIGSERHVLLDCPAGQMIVRQPADSRVASGDRLEATFNQKKVQFFDAADGKSIMVRQA
jgi:ABC-type sugar transport system ATPase subunit